MFKPVQLVQANICLASFLLLIVSFFIGFDCVPDHMPGTQAKPGAAV